MKGNFTLASLFSVLALTPMLALANPAELDVTVFCPAVTNTLSNYGDYIAGKGYAIVGNNGRNPVYFKSTSPLAPNTPTKLDNYRHEIADYDSTTGSVSCSYTNYDATKASFTVSYTLTNGKGGVVVVNSNDYVSIKLNVGLTSK
jgi:hypothetical protein